MMNKYTCVLSSLLVATADDDSSESRYIDLDLELA